MHIVCIQPCIIGMFINPCSGQAAYRAMKLAKDVDNMETLPMESQDMSPIRPMSPLLEGEESEEEGEEEESTTDEDVDDLEVIAVHDPDPIILEDDDVESPIPPTIMEESQPFEPEVPDSQFDPAGTQQDVPQESSPAEPAGIIGKGLEPPSRDGGKGAPPSDEMDVEDILDSEEEDGVKGAQSSKGVFREGT